MARNEFKPPSDFVADDSGGGKSSVWKWLGIGCGVIVLIVGGLLAAGAWKTVSCCNEAMDSVRLTKQAGEFSTEFARDLADGDVEQARAKMTEELTSKISADQLREQIAQYERFFESSPGRLSDINVEKTAADSPTIWSFTVEFAPPTGGQKLVVLTKVVSRGEGETQEFLVDDLRLEERSRDIASEPPAVDVLDFHRQLRAGSYEQAYRHMSDDFTQQSNLEAFRSFIREQKEVFRSGKIDIESVAYSGDGRATVIAYATDDSGERVRIEYQLEQPNPGVPKWLISGVTPTYETVESGSESGAEAGAESDSEDGSAADTEADTNEGDEQGDAEAEGAGEAGEAKGEEAEQQ